MSSGNIFVSDEVCRGTNYGAAKPGDPLLPKWRQITFTHAQPKVKVWATRAMRASIPKGWKRIRVQSHYRSYVRLNCYDPNAFALIDDAWIEQFWLKLLLIQE